MNTAFADLGVKMDDQVFEDSDNAEINTPVQYNTWEAKTWNGAITSFNGRDVWTDGTNAGFTTGKPWLPVNDNCSSINVEAALADPDSVFYYYQKLIALRKQHEVFHRGSFTLLLPEDEQRFVYRRDTEDQHLLVICNFNADTAPLEDIEIPAAAQLKLTNYADQEKCLQPYEARLYIW